MKKYIARIATGLLAAGLLVGVSATPSSAINDDSSWGRSVAPDKPMKPIKPGDTIGPRRPGPIGGTFR